MNDRELLELAAKAAAVAGYFVERTPEDGYPSYTCWITSGRQLILWNPLTDDGDALRLAVKLCMDIEINRDMVSALAPGAYAVEHIGDKDHGGGTRRAIVRAAAEIGRSL